MLLAPGKGCLWKSVSPWKVLLSLIFSGMVAKLIHGFCRAWTCTTSSWGQPWGLPQAHMHPTCLLTVQIRHKPKRKKHDRFFHWKIKNRNTEYCKVRQNKITLVWLDSPTCHLRNFFFFFFLFDSYFVIISALGWSELCPHMFGSEIVKNSYFSCAVRFQSQYSGKQLSAFLQLLFFD